MVRYERNATETYREEGEFLSLDKWERVVFLKEECKVQRLLGDQILIYVTFSVSKGETENKTVQGYLHHESEMAKMRDICWFAKINQSCPIYAH